MDIFFFLKKKKQNIFESYVKILHNLRNEYPTHNPLNYIAKLLLNSLYGRFGMQDNFDNIKIIHKNLLNEFELENLDSIIDEIDLGDHVMVFFKEKSDEEGITHNVSVGIASAIKAYSLKMEKKQ